MKIVHRAVRFAYVVGCCATLLGLLLPAWSAPLARMSPSMIAQPRLLADSTDLRIMGQGRLLARPLDPNIIKDITPPAKLDYSPYVTFMRVQDPYGGCVGHSICHIMDILKDWEHPYTPDVSFPLIWWLNGNKIAPVAESGGDASQIGDLRDYAVQHGLCAEALYHTDYDNATPVLSTVNRPEWELAVGEIYYWKPGPSAAADTESQLYHVVIGPDIAIQPGDPSPQVEELKKLLVKYGPIMAWGCGHSNTIVGFDDGQQRFKVLDNYGDWSDDKGYNYIPYDQLAAQKDTLIYLENVPTPRVGTADAYTARIKVHHKWRGTLNVYVGVEGQPPMTVWETHGRLKARQHETSCNLDIDVPLPAYAAKFWPPSPQHRWYLKVEDVDRDHMEGVITEFTLARLSAPPGNHSVGQYQTETYGGPCQAGVPDPSSGDWVTLTDADCAPPNPNPGSNTIYVPAQAAQGPALMMPTPRLFGASYLISLDPGKCGSTGPGAIQLGGSLIQSSPTSKPATGKTVGIYGLETNPCVNRPDEWKLINNVQTDFKGEFTYNGPRGSYAAFAAAFAGSDGKILASSNPMVVVLAHPGIELHQYIPAKPWMKLGDLTSLAPIRIQGIAPRLTPIH